MRGTLPVVLKVLQRLRPHRGLFALAILQVLLIGVLELAKPWPLKLVVDNLIAETAEGVELESRQPLPSPQERAPA